MHRPRVLIADDELAIIKFLNANLKAEGYEVLTAVNGREALAVIEKEAPDMVILDIMMPEMDGFEVCRRLREWSQVPVVMLSARGDEDDRVKCLNLGADDYVTKPFGIGELSARIKAIFRRVQAIGATPAVPRFRGGALEVSFAERRVSVKGNEVRLTPTEYHLLQELVLNSGKVLTYTHLLNRVWGTEYRDEKEYLHVFIGRLRGKLKADPEVPRCIRTVPGVGYQFKSPD